MSPCYVDFTRSLIVLSRATSLRFAAIPLPNSSHLWKSLVPQSKGFSSRPCSNAFTRDSGHDITRQITRQTVSKVPSAFARSIHTTPVFRARTPRTKPKASEHEERIPFLSLSHENLVQIFKYDIGHKEGNIILRIIQERRASGSLVEFGLHIDGAPDLPKGVISNALEWLRSKYPLDEQRAAQQWTQREVRKLEKSYIDRAERLGLYKTEPAENRGSWSTADTSTSVIDEFKRFHRERRETEAKERKESGVEQKEEELQLAKQDEAARKKEIWDAKLAERKAILAKQGMIKIEGRDADDESIPEMTKTQRLLPSTLFGAACLLAFYLLAENYSPPVKEQRLFPNVPVSVATVGGIVGVNVAIFCLWRIPRCQRTMNKFLMAVPSYPYAFSMLGNTFSHQQLRHLAANMSMVILYGVTLHEELGRGNFVALYLSGGTVGSIVSLYFYVLRNKLNSWHCGASGCVWAVTLAWAYLTARKPPSSTEDYSFAMDVSRYIVATINFLYHFTPGTMSTVDVVAHGAGAVTGLAGAHLWRENNVSKVAPPKGTDKERLSRHSANKNQE